MFKDFIIGADVEVGAVDSLLINAGRSQKCMQCHDGSSAKVIVLKDADTPMQIIGHRNANHPVGLVYREYAISKPGSYVSPEDLDERIVLENGNVGCISCHESRLSEDRSVQASINEQTCQSTGALTVGERQSDLCFSCHLM